MHEGHRERMRERLFAHGGSLTDHELLEIALFGCIGRKNTNPLAHDLLESFGTLKGVFSASPQLLCTVAGVGPQTAEYLHMIGLIMHRIRESESAFVRMYNYAEATEYIRGRYAGCAAEKTEIYLIDERGMLLCCKSFTEMRHGVVFIDLKELSFILSEVKPANLILSHNHPSGNPSPSDSDDATLAEVVRACRVHGVSVCDSVICADGKIFSYYYANRLARLGLDK